MNVATQHLVLSGQTHLSTLWKIPLSSSDCGDERRNLGSRPPPVISPSLLPATRLSRKATGPPINVLWKRVPAADKERKHPGQSCLQDDCNFGWVFSSSIGQEIVGAQHKATLLPADIFFLLILCLQIVAVKSETLSLSPNGGQMTILCVLFVMWPSRCCEVWRSVSSSGGYLGNQESPWHMLLCFWARAHFYPSGSNDSFMNGRVYPTEGTRGAFSQTVWVFVYSTYSFASVILLLRV